MTIASRRDIIKEGNIKMRCESWLKVWCPKCSTPNWFSQGDPDDMTGVDCEEGRCYKCRHVWSFINELDIYWTDDNEEYIVEEGLECPK